MTRERQASTETRERADAHGRELGTRDPKQVIEAARVFRPQRIRLWVLVSVLLGTGWPPHARGADWQVRQNSPGNFLTIQAAVDHAAAGDTITIHPGRYLEHAPFDFGALVEETYVVVTSPNLTIRGTSREAVIIGEETYIWDSIGEPNGIATTASGAGLIVEDLTIENVVNAFELDGAAHIRRVTLRGNHIGVYCHSGQRTICSNLLVEESRSSGFFCRSDSFHLSESIISGQYSRGFISQSDGSEVSATEFRDGAILQFQTFSSGSVNECRFRSGSLISLIESNVRIQNNRIDAGPSSNLVISSSEAYASNNVFGGGDDATILLFGGSNVHLENNHILHTVGESVNLQFFGETHWTVDLRNNWWGTSSEPTIASWILDAVVDPSRGGIVEWLPIATQPVPTRKLSQGELRSIFGPDRD